MNANMMFRAAGMLFLAQVATAQQTKVGLVHGIHSDGGTWTSIRNDLLGTGSFIVPPPISLTWTNPIATQATQQLQPWMTQQGFGPTSILAGHSQGGLVSRYGTRGFPLKGVLTMGTPNHGAAIASTAAAATMFAYMNALYGAEADLYFSFGDVRDQGPSHYLHNLVGSADHWGYLALYAALDIIGMGYAVARFDNRPQDFADLTPAGWPGASGFIANLNTNLGLELATQRAGIRFNLGTSGYYGGPFRLFASAAIADLAGLGVMIHGANLRGTALAILGALTWDDPYYFDHQLGAWAAYSLGDDLEYLPYLWHNDLIGGQPNDGLIYTGAQGIPGFSSEQDLSGIAHTEETGNANARDAVRLRLVQMASQ
jgi:hypothetical protein